MVDRQTIIAWLNDAYAMENAEIPILQNHARAMEMNPEARQRIERHEQETRRHAELVKGCIERLGSTPSTAKTALASAFGTIQSVSTGLFSDQPVKNTLMDYATEHFEIACYRALEIGAEAISESSIAETCREIMRDERDMAGWFYDHLPRVVALQPTKA